MKLSVTSLALLAVKAAATCHADNCYRAMFPCPSPSAVAVASAFCATITAGGTTAANYPTRATQACGTTPDQYISACACGPTCAATSTASACTATVTPHNLVPNGDFECGRSPWTIEVPDSSATAAVKSPGNTGSKSFEVMLPKPANQSETQFGVSARILSPAIPVVSGTEYILQYWTFFDAQPNGFIGVMVNNVPIKTTDAADLGWGAFHYNNVSWTAGSGVTTAVLKFEFLFGTVPSAIDRLDTISLLPADCA